MQPVLSSRRLCLRPFLPGDAKHVQRLAGDRRVAEPTATIPHPYPDGAAEAWIAGLDQAYVDKQSLTYAITLAETGELLGAIGLVAMALEHHQAEVGYWVGVPYWGQGYCSEALAPLMAFAQGEFAITRFTARCLATNPASARVLEKSGFTLEVQQLIPARFAEGQQILLLYGSSPVQPARQ